MIQITRLGEPRKQNGCDRRARPGSSSCRQATQYLSEKGAEKEGLTRRMEHQQMELINDHSGSRNGARFSVENESFSRHMG
jgi:hypothetical protein